MKGNFNTHFVLQGHWVVYTQHARGVDLSHVILCDSVFVPASVQSSLSEGTHIPKEHLIAALKLTIVRQVQLTFEGRGHQVSIRVLLWCSITSFYCTLHPSSFAALHRMSVAWHSGHLLDTPQIPVPILRLSATLKRWEIVQYFCLFVIIHLFAEIIIIIIYFGIHIYFLYSFFS